jgi:hypothetical protein
MMRNLLNAVTHVGGISTLILGFWLFGTQSAIAYTPPSTVNVTMYALNINTGARLTLCEPNDTRYGCTAVPSQPYPFGSTNPVTIQIDGTAVNNRYLRDVLPREMGPALFHPAALRAQAVAARTYALWHIQAGSTINNSIEFQAFVPRFYDTLSSTEKGLVDAALAPPRYYMSYHIPFANGFRTVQVDEPIFSEFSADAYLQTLTHPQQNPRHPYLLGVQDPISYDPAIPGIVSGGNAHQRGMSQNGAGRWARGSSSYREGFGVPWSVKLAGAPQILTHYYTGIHLREVGTPTLVNTPPNRWIPLRIGWGSPTNALPPFICPSSNYLLAVRLQNTGTASWPANQVRLEVTNASPSVEAILPATVSMGSSYTVTVVAKTPNLSPGTQFGFTLDMKMNGTQFSAQNPAWVAYTMEPRQVVNCNFTYMPHVQEGSVTAAQ